MIQQKRQFSRVNSKNGKRTRYRKEFQDGEHRASVTRAAAKLLIGSAANQSSNNDRIRTSPCPETTVTHTADR